jgi:hypothetical protein
VHEPPEDDWFGDSQPAPTAATGSMPDDDDWLANRAQSPSRGASQRSARLDRRVLLGAGLFTVALLAVLATSGVFSGGGRHATTSTTTSTTAPAITSATTTPRRPLRPSTPAPATALTPGTTGVQVKLLQRALASLGYSVGRADGDYGPATKKAVAAFQRAHHLAADGILGPRTLRALALALRRSG